MSFEAKAVKLIARLLEAFPNIYLFGACAVAGNGGEESGGLNPVQEQNPIGGGAGGWGWMQWTGARRVAFFAWCTQHTMDPNSDEANIGFLIEELRTTQRSALTAMLAVPSVDDKTKAFMDTFERPNAGYAHLDVRIRYAKRAYTAWLAQQPNPNPSPNPLPAPAPAPGPVPPPAQGNPPMANALDPIRNLVDELDNAIGGFDAEIDNVENFPFISAVVAPVGKMTDMVQAIADKIRATVDQLDPPAPPVAAPKV